MLSKRLIKSNNAGAGGCTNTVDLYNPFPDGGGVALYQLNGDATDVSGNYNGTWVGTPSYGTGQFGQAATFNGSNQGIDLPSLTNSYPFTVSAWINTSYFPNPDFSPIVQQNIGGQRVTIAATSVWGANQIAIAFGGTSQFSTDANSIPNNQWTQITACFRASTDFDFYINGSAANVTNNGGNHGGTAANAIGYNGVSTEWFNGSIDQVRIFNRALRPYEVEALYTEEYCTPTIVPSQHFNTVTWTSTGGNTDISVTGVGFQPDLVWAKARTDAYSHTLYDSVRGAGSSHFLSSNLTNSESSLAANAALYGYLGSFDADGFTGNAGTVDNSYFNFNTGKDYVAWNFKAGGAAVTNTDGTITSQVSANTEAGFSIVTFTNPTNDFITVGHGLGTAPQITIQKSRNTVSDWSVNTSVIDGSWDYASLNKTDAFNNSSLTPPTSSVFSAAGAADYVTYCFAEVEGFSNFGSYVGTGTTTGEKIITGFEPAFVMTKRIDAGSSWYIADNKRNPSDPRNLLINVNVSDPEIVGTGTSYFNFYENGFQVTASTAELNASGGKYIYMAFAADPTAVEPTLEDSFNTVLYTGTGTTNPRTDVGFQPDLTWVKGRSSADNHFLNDSVRGAGYTLYSNLTSQETLPSADAAISSFDSNGFTLSSSAGVNRSGSTYVAWNWKGAEIPAINSNGSIPSVVSANPAAGFSIVSYTGGNSSGTTVGHGLGKPLDVLIVKNRNDGTDQWITWHKDVERNSTSTDTFTLKGGNVLALNLTNSTISYNYDGQMGSIGGENLIAYCFAEVPGFSKFGSYTGTGGSTTVSGFGFEPAFLLIKRTDTNGSWVLQDNARGAGKSLFPDLSAAESLGWQTTFNSDGFNTTSGEAWINASGGTYIYMAFANQL